MIFKSDCKLFVKLYHDNSLLFLFQMQQPLAFYLRPTSLDQMVGQEPIKTTIQSFLQKGQVPSMIFR